MNGDGTVKSHQKISSLQGNFTGDIERYDYFGESLGVLSSEYPDQSTTLIVGSPRHGYETSREDSGAVWLLKLHTNKISDSQENLESFEGKLEPGDLDQSSRSTPIDGFEIEKFSPAKQINFGVLPEDVKCRESLVLVLKSISNSPACVKSESISKLIERGWGISLLANAIVSTSSNTDTKSSMEKIQESKAVGDYDEWHLTDFINFLHHEFPDDVKSELEEIFGESHEQILEDFYKEIPYLRPIPPDELSTTKVQQFQYFLLLY